MTLRARKKTRKRSEKCHHLRREKLKSLHIFCGRVLPRSLYIWSHFKKKNGIENKIEWKHCSGVRLFH